MKKLGSFNLIFRLFLEKPGYAQDFFHFCLVVKFSINAIMARGFLNIPVSS